MRIRRVKNKANLRDAAVDGFDMFLLSLVEDELTLTQLVEMVPRDALECVRHVLHLKRLELLEIIYDSFDEQLLLVRVGETAANDALDNARTLRPPPKRSAPRPGLQIGQVVPTKIAQVVPTSSGVRARPTPPEGTQAQKVK